jgi:hypothetical protein
MEEVDNEEYLYTIWCEWDIKQSSKIFESREDAMSWLAKNWLPKELGELQEAFETGLVRIQELEVIRPKKEDK